jgi:hypothetical protein
VFVHVYVLAHYVCKYLLKREVETRTGSFTCALRCSAVSAYLNVNRRERNQAAVSCWRWWQCTLPNIHNWIDCCWPGDTQKAAEHIYSPVPHILVPFLFYPPTLHLTLWAARSELISHFRLSQL